jgi:hypothetical protein
VSLISLPLRYHPLPAIVEQPSSDGKPSPAAVLSRNHRLCLGFRVAASAANLQQILSFRL